MNSSTDYYYASGGGGGSSYVYTLATANNYPNCLLSRSNYLSNTQLIAGNQSMPRHASNGTMTGNSGDGYVRLTYQADPTCFTVQEKEAYTFPRANGKQWTEAALSRAAEKLL